MARVWSVADSPLEAAENRSILTGNGRSASSQGLLWLMRDFGAHARAAPRTLYAASGRSTCYRRR
jgi:hypothetical protein